MTNTLLNVSGKLNPIEVEIFDSIYRATSQLGIPFLVIGASKISSVATRTHFVRLQAGEIIPQGIEQLVTEMADDDDHHERNRSLLEAYFTGMVHANR
jgi:hypothetical protein